MGAIVPIVKISVPFVPCSFEKQEPQKVPRPRHIHVPDRLMCSRRGIGSSAEAVRFEKAIVVAKFFLDLKRSL